VTSDETRTHAELIEEMEALRGRVVELESAAATDQVVQALRDSERRFRLTFDRAPVGVANVALDGRFLRVNQRFCDILGYTQEELLQLDFPTVTHPDTLAADWAFVKQLLEGDDETLALEKRCLRKDGSEVWGNLMVSVMRDPEGQPLYFIAVMKDISERKQAEMDLRRTQFAVDHASVSAFWIGPDARFLYVNEAACQTLDYSRDELLALTVHDIDPGFPASVWAEHWRTLRQQRSLRFESHHRAKSGRLIPVEVSINYVVFEGREYNFAFARDISERKKAEEALRESEERFRNIVQSSPMGIIMYRLDRDGRLVFTGANPAADQILGIDNSQFMGKTLEEAYPALAGTEVPPAYRRVCSEGVPWSTEQIDYEDERIGGAYEVYAFQTSPGTMAVLFLDITERKRAEAERLRLEEQLRHAQKMEAVGELAGGIAHDFNNVLTAVQGNAELLRALLPAESEQAEFAEEILKASHRAADLTRQLLAFARKGRFETAVVDVHELIREVATMLSHGIDRRIEVELDLAAENAGVLGDSSQLQSALLNLGLNARDAMPTGGTLTYSTRCLWMDEAHCRLEPYEIVPGEYIEIAVADTGVGMDRDLQQRVFEPFFTTKDRGKGTGLGLAGVYGCAKSHRGGIRVYSEPGMGSTFRLLLPLATGRDGGAAASARPQAGVVRGTGHLLLVDDEEMVRTFAASALRSLGYVVSTCTDGAEAVAFFQRNREEIDLVILDLIMPRLSGADAFARMREIDPEVKVLVSSGFNRNGTADALVAQGALGFLHKPFRIDELSQAVARHVARQEP